MKLSPELEAELLAIYGDLTKWKQRLAILLALRDAPEIEPVEGTWTLASKGDATGSIVENSSTSLSITAQGNSDNAPDIDYAYQSVASGDIQLIVRVPAKGDWSGHNESFTSFGAGLSEGTGDSDWFAHAQTYFNEDGTRIKSGIPGALTTQSGQTGQTYPRYLALTYDFSATAVAAWESADGTDWFQIGSTVTKNLSYPVLAYAFGCSHDTFSATTATLTGCVLSSTITISEATPPDPVPRQIHFDGSFESGQVNDMAESVDGYRIRTLPEPQVTNEIVVIADGGAGPSADIDTKVVASETPPTSGNGAGNQVLPRNGSYFCRSILYFDKDYGELQGGLDKPRSGINPEHDNNRIDFDVEGYLGFSIFLPNNFETENPARRLMFLQVQSQGSSWTLFKLEVDAPDVGTGRWALKLYIDDESVRHASTSTETWYDLGAYSGDLDKWTDFVIRYRFNPFTTTTNASTISGGKNQSYEGNKGIFQVWKTTGAVDGSGNRAFSQVGPNIVNAPVGLVPHATERISWHFRAYKPSWKTSSTSVDGPVWIGFDEIRYGGVLEDGTTFADVSADRSSTP